MHMRPLFISAFLIMFVLGTVTVYAKNEEPDFSSPDSAYNSIQQARNDGRYDVMLQGFSQYYKEDHGLTGPDATTILKGKAEEVRKKHPDAYKLRKVEKVEYSLDGSIATIHLSGEQFVFMMKENGRWVSEYRRPMSGDQRVKMEKTITMLNKMQTVTDPNAHLARSERKRSEKEIKALDKEVSSH